MSKTNTLYGIPYMGSKTKIAPIILKYLPKGKRFVDLFGGGFAMSHCAFLSHRYDQVLYNDYNPLVVDLIKRGLPFMVDRSIMPLLFSTISTGGVYVWASSSALGAS